MVSEPPGDTRPTLRVIAVDRADTGPMDGVVGAAYSLAEAGDAVLLAPRSASKDTYAGYTPRGDAFAVAVRHLHEIG